MSIKTEVAGLIARQAASVAVESEEYAAIGEYGVSDRLDRIVEGLTLARQAYLDSFKSEAELAGYVIPESLTEFLKTAPTGSTLVDGAAEALKTPYAIAIGDGVWKSRHGSTWTSSDFVDGEQGYAKVVPSV